VGPLKCDPIKRLITLTSDYNERISLYTAITRPTVKPLMFTTIGTLKITVRQAGSSVQAGFTVQVALVICGLESSNWLIHIGKIVVNVYFLVKNGLF